MKTTTQGTGPKGIGHSSMKKEDKAPGLQGPDPYVPVYFPLFST